MKRILTSITAVIFSAPFAFAEFGLPTFDFSNLVSSIESIASAVKFYDESIKQAKEYKERLESLGKTFSADTFKNFLSGFQNGELGFQSVLSSIENFKSVMDEECEAFEEELRTFDNNLNEYLGINTNGTITELGEKITKYVSPSGIENIVADELDSLMGSLDETKKKRDELISTFKEEKQKLDNDIEKIKSEIEKAENEGKESQVALEMLSIKNSELQFLRDERRALESKYDEILREVNATIASYERELDRVRRASDTLISNLRNASLIDDETEGMLREINSYKPKYKFSI